MLLEEKFQWERPKKTHIPFYWIKLSILNVGDSSPSQKWMHTILCNRSTQIVQQVSTLEKVHARLYVHGTSSLHGSSSRRTSPTQLSPPHAWNGLSQFLVLCLLPPWQSELQADHSLHSDTPPLTKKRWDDDIRSNPGWSIHYEGKEATPRSRR